jgi:hypothetical protein
MFDLHTHTEAYFFKGGCSHYTDTSEPVVGCGANLSAESPMVGTDVNPKLSVVGSQWFDYCFTSAGTETY